MVKRIIRTITGKRSQKVIMKMEMQGMKKLEGLIADLHILDSIVFMDYDHILVQSGGLAEEISSPFSSRDEYEHAVKRFVEQERNNIGYDHMDLGCNNYRIYCDKKNHQKLFIVQHPWQSTSAL